MTLCPTGNGILDRQGRADTNQREIDRNRPDTTRDKRPAAAGTARVWCGYDASQVIFNGSDDEVLTVNLTNDTGQSVYLHVICTGQVGVVPDDAGVFNGYVAAWELALWVDGVEARRWTTQLKINYDKTNNPGDEVRVPFQLDWTLTDVLAGNTRAVKLTAMDRTYGFDPCADVGPFVVTIRNVSLVVIASRPLAADQ